MVREWADRRGKSARILILDDKLELIGEDKSGLCLFDRDIAATR